MENIICKVMKKNGNPTNIRAIRNAETSNLICYAEKRTLRDYHEECANGGNECATRIEVFNRIKDNTKAILWCDWETGETFISY